MKVGNSDFSLHFMLHAPDVSAAFTSMHSVRQPTGYDVPRLEPRAAKLPIPNPDHDGRLSGFIASMAADARTYSAYPSVKRLLVTPKPSITSDTRDLPQEFQLDLVLCPCCQVLARWVSEEVGVRDV